MNYFWGTGNDWKNLPGTAHTDRQTLPLLLLYIRLPKFGLDTKTTNSSINPLKASFEYQGRRTKEMNIHFSHHISYESIFPTKNHLVGTKEILNLEFL